jgi:CDP-4-dehydro-6-deoxyglucose reductase
LGTFFLRDIQDADLVFLATGTGIAPVKAMLEGLSENTTSPMPRSVSVFWGGRRPEDIYWTPRDEHGVREFVPVLSRAKEDWSGHRGHVQHALMARRLNLAQVRVFACGSDAMIHDARRELVAAGLDERHFHSDAFVCSATT